MQKTIAIILYSFLATGCAVETSSKPSASETIKSNVRVVLLDNGLRCAVYKSYLNNASGLDCDWSTYGE